MPIIMLEGTERVGKTAFFNYLVEKADNIFPLETALLKKNFKNPNNIFKTEAISHFILEFLSEKFPNYFFLIDRGIPSGLVYNEFFNRGTNPFVSSEDILKNLIARNSLFIIFLRFKNRKILETKINESPDELLNDENEIWKIQEAFEVFFSKSIPSDLVFVIEVEKKKFTKKDFNFFYNILNEKLLNIFKEGLL